MASPDESDIQQQLHREIAFVKAEIATLTRRRSILQHGLLSRRETRRRLLASRESQAPTNRAAIDNALSEISEQEKHITSNHYRSLLGITSFRAKDPDPNAVDEGSILGIRLDVWNSREKAFKTPHYVLLVSPWKPHSQAYRVHRHTIPAFVNLKALEEKYLPEPSVAGSVKIQRLGAFAHALRRDLLMGYRSIDRQA